MNKTLEQGTEILHDFEVLIKADSIENIVSGLRLNRRKLIRYLCVKEYEKRKKDIITGNTSEDRYCKAIMDLAIKYNLTTSIVTKWVYNVR